MNDTHYWLGWIADLALYALTVVTFAGWCWWVALT